MKFEAFLQENDITNEEIMQITGWSRQNLALIRVGEQEPNCQRFIALCDRYGYKEISGCFRGQSPLKRVNKTKEGLSK